MNDFTLWSYGLLKSITGWEVSSEPYLPDNRHILFTLWGSVPVLLIRNPRDANWCSFREGLREKLERDPQINMKYEAGLGLAVHCVQQALIYAYENNCPLIPVTNVRKSLKSLRREVRRLFNRCRAYNSCSWELYRETQWRYRKEVRKASKETWRTFCNPLTICIVQLGYKGLFKGTLKSGWDLW